MTFKKQILLIIVICLTAILFANSNPVLVEVGDTVITRDDLLNKIGTLSTMSTARFMTVEGQKQILEMMITEQLFYLKAVELGYDKLEEVLDAVVFHSIPVANMMYVEDVIAREYTFDPAAIEVFYNENLHFYTIPARVIIQHLQVEEDDVEAVLRDIANGVEFEEIIQNRSTNNSTKTNSGIVGNIRLTGFITGIGQDPILETHISEVTVDVEQIYGPFTTETGVHFFRKLEHIEAYIRPLEELRTEIEGIVRGRGESETYNQHIRSLYTKYDVVFDSSILETVPIFDLELSRRDDILVQSSRPNIQMTFAEALYILQSTTRREIIESIGNPSVQADLIREELDKKVLTEAALDAKIYETRKDMYEFEEVRLRVILSYFNNEEINKKIIITPEELLEFYENNKDMYTVPAYRNIREFVASDEKSAKTHHTAISRMLRRRQHDRIVEYINKESLKGGNGGFLEYIYNNNLIPSLGVDVVYNQKVFATKVGQLSDIFRNVDDEIVFFYVVSEAPARVRVLSEVENSLMNIIHRRRATVLFDELKEELAEYYTVTTHFDRLVPEMTPEELFSHAELLQRMGQVNDTFFLFDAIVNDFPDSEYAYRALFMKGFVASESEETINIAISAFEDLLEMFPDGEMNESAEFLLDMLKNGEIFEW